MAHPVITIRHFSSIRSFVYQTLSMYRTLELSTSGPDTTSYVAQNKTKVSGKLYFSPGSF